MLAIGMTVEVSGLSALSIRQQRRIRKDAYRAMGLMWQRKFMRRHFSSGNRRRYGHRARRPGYLKRKQFFGRKGRDPQGRPVKKRGHVDLVYTGTMERMLRRPQVVRGYPSRCTIRMQGPFYVSMRPKDPQKPHKAAEVLNVTVAEQQQLYQFLNHYIVEAIKRAPARKKTMIRPH